MAGQPRVPGAGGPCQPGPQLLEVRQVTAVPGQRPCCSGSTDRMSGSRLPEVTTGSHDTRSRWRSSPRLFPCGSQQTRHKTSLPTSKEGRAGIRGRFGTQQKRPSEAMRPPATPAATWPQDAARRLHSHAWARRSPGRLAEAQRSLPGPQPRPHIRLKEPPGSLSWSSW